ncbi:MAG TPA: hypothetical protein VEA69_14715 [Tepidisphaeraceae bacterium]|nr:hypothetical protein [Tepidisphaeraceae bacterium]
MATRPPTQLPNDLNTMAEGDTTDDRCIHQGEPDYCHCRRHKKKQK